ncbi:MAG: di-trans,poly-cis-decaprenylcistransferase [Nanoarchaeota archaeon]|nr:di-trans,poly-cis-decaprenylcistransferase [Nanoarchaeota archaeon]MBU1027608.1 di-trans,poly-cis-decaprenylcistransferase [Nanoarchaeota archaeon]
MKKLNIGIILDGNRRFAKRLMKEPWKGHEYGAKKLNSLLEWCKEFKIKELTLYCLSIENFNRPKKEFNYLMKVFKKEAENILKDPRIDKEKIKINFIGKINLLDKDLQGLIKKIKNKTKSYKNHIINIAIAYGGRQEIINTIKKLIKFKKPINEKNFQKELWISNEPDFIIRTGGEKRTSNFLPWQSTYSEWFFLDKMWPEFEKKDLQNCIQEFYTRQRRFGK